VSLTCTIPVYSAQFKRLQVSDTETVHSEKRPVANVQIAKPECKTSNKTISHIAVLLFAKTRLIGSKMVFYTLNNERNLEECDATMFYSTTSALAP